MAPLTSSPVSQGALLSDLQRFALGIMTDRIIAMNSVHRHRSRPLRAVGWVLALVAGVALIGLASDNASRFACGADPHTVQYGDTLWAIAEAKCNGNIQAVTDNLVDTYGANIQLGDTIWLPTNQDCLLENRGGEVYDECG